MVYFHAAAASPRALVCLSFFALLVVLLAGVPAALMAADTLRGAPGDRRSEH